MRNFVNSIDHVVVWTLFFATTVYGHVALKVAMGTQAAYDVRHVSKAVTNLWGITALAAWTVSSLLWALVLTRNSVVLANSISSLRYVLITIAAVLWLGETITFKQSVGMIAIVGGIWLLAN